MKTSLRTFLLLPAACALAFGSAPNAQAVETVNPGTGDQTTVIQTAINNAKAAGSYVMINSGTYNHSGNITINGAVEVRGNNDATVLVATNPENASVILTGTGAKLRNIKVKTNFSGPFVANSVNRSQADLSCPVYVKDAIDFLVENVTSEFSKGGGMMVNNSRGTSSASKARIINCRARTTLADGIHITNGSKWIRVENCNNTNTGDDLIGIVSKGSQTNVCTDIIVHNNTVSEGLWGRGITVVGGTNITISNNTITNPSGSGILLASEGGTYDTYHVSGVTVSNNTITGGNSDNRSGQNGINIIGRDDAGTLRKISNCTFTNNTVNNSTGRGVIIGKYTENITLTDTKINGATAAGIEIVKDTTATNADPKNITITGTSTLPSALKSSIKNTGAQGISAPNATGTLQIRNTQFEQINKNGVSDTDVIRVADGANLAVTITGCKYTNPAPAGVHYYIECAETNITTFSPINTTDTPEVSTPADLSD